MTPSIRWLLLKARDQFEVARDELWRSQEVDGVIDDADIAAEQERDQLRSAARVAAMEKTRGLKR